MSESLYTISNLKYRYNERFMLDIPDLAIARGTCLGLVGPNGSGKSTLLKILAFLELPQGGEISFQGVKVTGGEEHFKRKVTILLQEPYLLKRSVFDNIAYGLKVRGEERELKKKVFDALLMVGLPPENFARRRWYELSGGEAQRVALASRMVIRPDVLILDEPTASIDQSSAVLVKEAIKRIRERYDTTIIIASHDLVWLQGVTDSILKLYEGRVVGVGAENLLLGPWERDATGLWKKNLPDRQSILVSEPPGKNAIGILSPSDIILSATSLPSESLSARNVLHGKVSYMVAEGISENVTVEVLVAETPFHCRITCQAADELRLLPGKEVRIIFKASAIQWKAS